MYSFVPGDDSSVELLTEDDTIEAQVAKVRKREPGRGGIKGQLVQFVGIGRELSPHILAQRGESSKKAFAISSARTLSGPGYKCGRIYDPGH